MRELFQLGEELEDRERRKGWLVVAMFVAFVTAVLVFPHSPVDGVVLCPFRWLTGLSCPGCGMTRACIHLLHGDLQASLVFHPFGWLFVLGFALTALHRLVQNVFGRRLSYPGRRFWKRKDNPVLIGCLIALAAFGAIRLALELSGFLTPV